MAMNICSTCVDANLCYYFQYLDRIGQLFFGVPPPTNQSQQGLLGERTFPDQSSTLAGDHYTMSEGLGACILGVEGYKITAPCYPRVSKLHGSFNRGS